MTGARLNATLDDKIYRSAVSKLGGVLHSQIPRAIGVALVEQTIRRIETGKDAWGRPFTPLNPAYAMIKRGPGILRESSMLLRSITSQVSGLTIAVGSNRIYAAVHQFGATITAKGPKGLSFRLGTVGPKGGIRRAWVHVQSVKIPARPYLGFGEKDRTAVREVLASFYGQVFR